MLGALIVLCAAVVVLVGLVVWRVLGTPRESLLLGMIYAQQAEREEWIRAFIAKNASELARFDQVDAQVASFAAAAEAARERTLARDYEAYADAVRFETVGGVPA